MSLSDEPASAGGFSPMSRRRHDWIALALSLAACLATSVVGGIATASSVGSWYPNLNKPSWNPPDAVFGPVWTMLYLMMAVAAWLVWRRRDEAAVRPALVLFGVQLLLNAGWSAVFFGLRQPGLAVLEIILLWLAIAATLWAFARRSTAAALLLAPYLGWVSFAGVLNFAIWRLNA